MMGAVHVLLALRDRQLMRPMIADMDDACVFDMVTSGRQALEVCKKAPPDILVIDAVLAEMDGLAVVERLRDELGERMPRVVACVRTPFSREGFLRRGAHAVVSIPCETQRMKDAIAHEIKHIKVHVDWTDLRAAQFRAGALLTQMGMHASLKGYAYLCSAAALAYESESRLFSVGKGIYEPIAAHHGTTAQSVERLIRHAIESTMSAARAKGVYSLFGNTIDPAKGKPTNAQVIAMLVQRMRVEKRQTG